MFFMWNGGVLHGRSTLKEVRDYFCGEINVECLQQYLSA